MKTLLILLMLTSNSYAARNTLPKVVRVGNMNLTESMISIQTGIVIDDKNTAYLMSVFGNGDVRTMRVSNEGVVKEAVMDKGWPYIVDKYGRLYALDVSLLTRFIVKTPTVVGTLASHFKYAVATGGAFAIGSHVNTGFFNINLPHMVTAATSGFVAFYVVDALYTSLFLTPRKLGISGNYFRKLIARKVDHLEYNEAMNTYEIHYRGKQSSYDSRTFLRDVVPPYVRETSCIYQLSRIEND